MANPRPPLAGWADRGDPNWKANALERVNAKQATSKMARRRKAALQMYFDPPFLDLIRTAARLRGMSAGAYARRAVGSWIAHDLGMDRAQVMKHCARVSRHSEITALPGDKGERTSDDGQGYGPWNILRSG